MGKGRRIILAILGISGVLCGLFLIPITLGYFTAELFFFVNRLTGDLRYTVLGFLLLAVGIIFLLFLHRAVKRRKSGNLLTLLRLERSAFPFGQLKIWF